MKRDIRRKKISVSGFLVLSDMTLFVHFWHFIIVGFRTSFRMKYYSEIMIFDTFPYSAVRNHVLFNAA
jgi:hypothetical protein